MARSLGVSLAEAYPQVAATWLQERNGGLRPQTATPKMRVAVWWRCPAGHDWEEDISNRTSLRKWKNGDVAACRECVGYRVSRTYPECGHTAMVTPEAAAKKKPRCWDCYQKVLPRLKAELSAAAKAAAGRAAELLDAVELPRDLPAPLATEWRWWATKHLQGAIAAEEKLGKDGERDRGLARVTAAAATLLPTKEAAGRAAAADGVLRLVDQAHWAEGWLHQLTGRRPRPAAADGLDTIAFLLGEVLADWSQGAAEAVAANRANGHPAPTTAEITRSLTRAVLSTTDDEAFAPLARYLRPYPLWVRTRCGSASAKAASWSSTSATPYEACVKPAPEPTARAYGRRSCLREDEEQEAQELARLLPLEDLGEPFAGAGSRGRFADDVDPEAGRGERVGDRVQRPVPEGHQVLGVAEFPPLGGGAGREVVGSRRCGHMLDEGVVDGPDEAAAGLQHAPQFGQGRRPVLQVVQDQGGDDVVEPGVGEGQRAAQFGAFQHHALAEPPPGQLQHPGAGVEAGDDGAPLAQVCGHGAGAAAGVEDAAARHVAGQVHYRGARIVGVEEAGLVPGRVRLGETVVVVHPLPGPRRSLDGTDPGRHLPVRWNIRLFCRALGSGGPARRSGTIRHG
jgi:hypothetical protein